MNKTLLYSGLFMLFAPFLLLGLFLLVSQLNLDLLIALFIEISYFGTALFLIIKGATDETL